MQSREALLAQKRPSSDQPSFMNLKLLQESHTSNSEHGTPHGRDLRDRAMMGPHLPTRPPSF